MTKSRKHAATSRGVKAYRLNQVLKNNGFKFYSSHFKGEKGKFFINLRENDFILYCKGEGAIMVEDYGRGTMKAIKDRMKDFLNK